MVLSKGICGYALTCVDPDKEQGVQTPPLENHKAKGILISAGLEPQKIRELPSHHLVSGHYLLAREMHLVVFLSSLPTLKNLVRVKLDPLLQDFLDPWMNKYQFLAHWPIYIF